MSNLMLFLSFGGGEIIVVLLVILLFFGSKKIPELARGLGRGMREFKDATSGVQREIEESMREKPKPKPKVESSQTPITDSTPSPPTHQTDERSVSRD